MDGLLVSLRQGARKCSALVRTIVWNYDNIQVIAKWIRLKKIFNLLEPEYYI